MLSTHLVAQVSAQPRTSDYTLMHKLGLFLGVAMALSGNHSRADELLLLNWEDYLAESVVAKFEAQTGHTIKTVYFDNDNERDEILVSAAGANFDLAVMDSSALIPFSKNNYLETLPPNLLNNIDERWKNSCGQTGLPYFWGTVGLVYRLDQFPQPPNSWRTLVYPDEHLQGHIGMHKDNIDTLVPALKLMGRSVNTENIEELRAAYNMLLQQRPHVLTYEYAQTFYENAPNGEELYLALAYSGDEYGLNNDDDEPRWAYSIPTEGTTLWVDCLVIMATSDKKTAAQQFIRFLSQPDIAAENAEEIGSATPNKLAKALLDPSILADKTIYPADSILQASENYKALKPETIGLRNRIVQSLAH